MRRGWSGFGLAVLLVCGAPFLSQALAQKVDFQVHVIRATTKNDKVDPKLKAIAGQLQKQFKFKGFTLERTLRGSAAMNSAFSSKLPGGYSLSLVPKARSDKQIEIELSVKRTVSGKEKLVNRFKLKITPGKTVLNGGWPLAGGDRQMLAISAR